MGKTKQQTKKFKYDFDWQGYASAVAEEMHEDHFNSHYGWDNFTAGGLPLGKKGYYYYSNHPNDTRHELLASIREWAKHNKFTEEAFASYGCEVLVGYDLNKTVYDPDYTVAMLFIGPAKAEEKFHAAMERLHREWYTRLLARDRVEPEPVAEVIDIKRARSQVEVSAQVSALVDSVKAGE